MAGISAPLENILKISGAAAGVGGLGLAFTYVFYFNFLHAKFMPDLESRDATTLLFFICLLVFCLAVLSVAFWMFYSNARRTMANFLKIAGASVVTIALFLVFLYLMAPDLNIRTPPTSATLFEQIEDAIRTGDLETATLKLRSAEQVHSGNAELGYWSARLAFAENKLKLAYRRAYRAVNQTAASDDLRTLHVRSRILWLALLVIDPSVDDSVSKENNVLVNLAERFAETLDSESFLDWVQCVKRIGYFTDILVSRSRLEKDCPIDRSLRNNISLHSTSLPV